MERSTIVDRVLAFDAELWPFQLVETNLDLVEDFVSVFNAGVILQLQGIVKPRRQGIGDGQTRVCVCIRGRRWIILVKRLEILRVPMDLEIIW